MKKNNKVVTIDNLSTDKIENIHNGCIFIEGNDYDTAVIEKLNDYKFYKFFHIAG